MVALKLSECFKYNFFQLKVFAIWPGEKWHKYYLYYSILFLCTTLFIYDVLVIFSIIFTPLQIEEMIPEIVFLFTEVTVLGKVFMVLLLRKKLFAAFDILDCEAFKGDDEGCTKIIERHVSKFKNGWKMYVLLGTISYVAKVFIPIITYMIFNTSIELPVSRYQFLDNKAVKRYFSFWYIYQSLGLLSHLQYNMSIDTLIAGLLFMAITQVRVLKHEMKKLKVINIRNCDVLKVDELQMKLLNKYLKHYEMLLHYCDLIQDLVGVTMFIQFSMSSVMICIVLCRLLMPVTVEFLLFIVTYLCAIVLQIFVPSWLGTQLTYESAELLTTAYSIEWITRSERFKRSLKLFMTRASTGIVITGGQIFPLSFDTFTSLVKLAYSFFTLIRNVQDD